MNSVMPESGINVHNPVDGSLVGSVPRASEAQIQSIVQKSLKAASEWKRVPVYRRAELMYKYADKIRTKQESIARLECAEMGKRITECRGEADVAARIFEGYAERIKHMYSEVLPQSQPGIESDIIYTVREPIGPIACIVPFNYPVELYSQKAAPAIAAGNPIIVKPASTNPLAVKMMIELADDIGFPENLIQFVSGSGADVGKWLVTNPDIAAVSLTGSTDVGIRIMVNAAPNLHRVFLELGGNDAFIVHEDSDLELAANEAIEGRLQNTGQTCCAPKRFIIHNSVKDTFADLLVDRLKKIRITNPADEDSDLGCIISKSALDTVMKQIDICISEGCTLYWGGERLENNFFKPAVITNVLPKCSVATDMEIFGPVFPIIGFETDEEAVRIANSSQFGLSGAVFSGNYKRALQQAAALECGCTVINGHGTYRTLDQPFGGYKKSGIGREGMLNTLEEMSQLKTIVLKGML